MRVSEFAEVHKNIIAHAADIMWTKMKDYAREEDALHNFRRAAEAAGISPLQVWFVFADKHWGAIARFIRDGKVESEAIRDRIADLINYCTLLQGLIEDSGGPAKIRI